MHSRGHTLSKATSALQEYFPNINIPTYRPGDSLFSLLDTITSQTRPPSHPSAAIHRMKTASQAQQYRIQRSYLSMDIEHQPVSLEDICYEMPSTGILNQKEMFARSEKEVSELGDRIHNLIDEVWWNNEKKEQSQYFMG